MAFFRALTSASGGGGTYSVLDYIWENTANTKRYTFQQNYSHILVMAFSYGITSHVSGTENIIQKSQSEGGTNNCWQPIREYRNIKSGDYIDVQCVTISGASRVGFTVMNCS